MSSSTAEIDALVAASLEIGQGIDVVSSIADQTNLLALNATIEAARAGDFGRGFVVVADEVKTLSGETATATERISSMIANIRERGNGVRSSADQLADDLRSLHEGAREVASAVGGQRESTLRLQNLITESGEGTRASCDGTALAARALAELAGALRDLVSELDMSQSSSATAPVADSASTPALVG